MPRRLPLRPAKIVGNLFVLFVLIVISTIYYTYVWVVMGPKIEEELYVSVLLVVFHCLFLMLVWSFFQSMTTDPGQVPVFWGFHLGDPENKRRRYCLMCNVFKPERCHHCSACNRCVLNMDHHCPWINNCIGFWNRKYFMLLLVYVLLTTYYVLITLFYEFMLSIKWEIDTFYYSKSDSDKQKLVRCLTIQVSYILTGIVAVLMTMFLRFHIFLATTNKTTIENLDKKGKPFRSPFDIGETLNLQQIFGTNKWLWPFPVFFSSGKPMGDGIYWPTFAQQDAQSHYSSNGAKNQSAAKNVQSPTGNQTQARSQDQSQQVARQQQQHVPSQNSFQTNFAGGQGRQQYDPNNVSNLTAQINSSYTNQVVNPKNIITTYPQNFGQGVGGGGAFVGSQEIGQPQNRIIMHGQDKEMLKKNLNQAIFQNNQRAQQLNQQFYGGAAGGSRQTEQLQPPQQRSFQQPNAQGTLAQQTSGKTLPKNKRDLTNVAAPVQTQQSRISNSAQGANSVQTKKTVNPAQRR